MRAIRKMEEIISLPEKVAISIGFVESLVMFLWSLYDFFFGKI